MPFVSIELNIWEISSHQRRKSAKIICLGSSYWTHCPSQSLYHSGSGWTVESDISKTRTYQIQVDPAEDERSRYVQKIDSKWVFTHLWFPVLLSNTHYKYGVWRKCNPSTWSSNIQGMWRLTFYPRNPYEATGMVKRPWDQQVFFLSNANTQMFISFIKIFYFNCP